jgi:hypothetical protein
MYNAPEIIATGGLGLVSARVFCLRFYCTMIQG